MLWTRGYYRGAGFLQSLSPHIAWHHLLLLLMMMMMMMMIIMTMMTMMMPMSAEIAFLFFCAEFLYAFGSRC